MTPQEIERAARAMHQLAMPMFEWKDEDETVRGGYIEDARIILEAASALSVAEPEGWKLVPVEPTEEMEFAGLKAADAFIGKAATYDAELSSATYSAMLAVAPSVPSSIAEPAAWRTMESAPKDGRAVLLLSLAYDTHNDADDTTYHHPAKCHIGKWNPAGDSWTDELGGYAGEICTLTITGVWDSGGGWFQPNEITHWQPLPAAPSAPSVGQPLTDVSSSGEREDASDPSLSAGPPVGQNHDPKTGPCPTCGFRVRETTKKPFVIEDDSALPPASPALHSQRRAELEAERAQLLTANEAATGWASTGTTAAAFKCTHPACQDNTTGKCKGACSFTAANQIPAQPVSGTEGRFDAASCWAWLNHVDSKDVETIIEQFTKSNCLEYTPEEERFGIQRALRGTVEGLLARALSSEATIASLQSQLAEARADLAEWEQAASVEAGLRREFLARAKKAEAELTAAHATIAEQRGALEFYADPFAWKKKNDPCGVVRVPDFYDETCFGDNAKAALAPAGEK